MALSKAKNTATPRWRMQVVLLRYEGENKGKSSITGNISIYSVILYYEPVPSIGCSLTGSQSILLCTRCELLLKNKS